MKLKIIAHQPVFNYQVTHWQQLKLNRLSNRQAPWMKTDNIQWILYNFITLVGSYQPPPPRPEKPDFANFTFSLPLSNLQFNGLKVHLARLDSIRNCLCVAFLLELISCCQSKVRSWKIRWCVFAVKASQCHGKVIFISPTRKLSFHREEIQSFKTAIAVVFIGITDFSLLLNVNISALFKLNLTKN